MDTHGTGDRSDLPPAPPRRPDSDGMPRWIERAMVLAGLTFLATIGVLNLIRRLNGFLIMLLVALFLSFALEPAVQYLTKRGWRRHRATMVVFAGAFAVVALFLGAMMPLFAAQAGRLIDDIPGYVERLSEFTERSLGLELSMERLSTALDDVAIALQARAGEVAGRVFGFGTLVVSLIVRALAIALFAYYLVADGPRLRRVVLSMLPPERQREVLRIWEIAIEKTGGYVYSRVLLAVASGLFTWVVLRALAIPFALALALWVGVLSQFVPTIGTYLAAILPVLVAFFESPTKALWVLLALVAYQQVENYLLNPRITAHTMALHPAVSFGSVIVGATLLGGVGAVLAIPAAAIIQAFVSTYLERHAVIDSELTRIAAEDPHPPEPWWRRWQRAVQEPSDPPSTTGRGAPPRGEDG